MKTLLIATLAAAGLAVCACTGHATPRPTETVTVHASTAATTQPSTPAPGGQGGQTQSGQSGQSGQTQYGQYGQYGQGGQPQQSPVVPPGAPPGCLSRYLYAKPGLIQGTSTRTYLVVQFKNLDNVPCSLYGYPGVALDTGLPVHQIGRPAAEDPATPRELVILQPHRWANALLTIANAHNYPPATCHVITASGIQVIPPNQSIPLYIPFNTQTCKNIVTMTVGAVRPGRAGSV
ncbi:MAG TPA: DUF4232 domain-containing protein [Streptosporangiaceae bacterium]